MCSICMMSKGRGSHCLVTLIANYPSPIPFPKVVPPMWLVVCTLRLPLSPDEPRRAYHILGLIQVCLQSDPLKHSYHFFQRCMHPDRISPCYPSVICIEACVVFPRRPPKTVLSLLGSTDLLKGCPDYCIHYIIYSVCMCVNWSPEAKSVTKL